MSEAEIESMLEELESARSALHSTQSAIEALQRENHDLREAQEKASADREQYRALYMQLLERCRLLELGLVAGKKAERFGGEDEKQLSMQLLGMLLAEGEAPTEEVDEAADGDDDVGDLGDDEDDETEPGDTCQPRRRRRRRRKLPEALPRSEIWAERDRKLADAHELRRKRRELDHGVAA